MSTVLHKPHYYGKTNRKDRMPPTYLNSAKAEDSKDVNFTTKNEYFVKCKNFHLHFLHDKFDIFERNMSRNIPYAPWKTIPEEISSI